jgi:hypothetical protein
LILDSVCTRHRAHPDGNKGTQTFWLSEDQRLPLHVRGGLMTFAFSKPSWEELRTLDIMDITTEIPWHPILHSDEPLALRSMNENTVFQAMRQDPLASKGGVMTSVSDVQDTAAEIQVPRCFHHALELDALNGTTAWKESIEKELSEEDDHLEDFFETQPYGTSFGIAKNESEDQEMFFFDPGDITEKGQFGKAFHLTLNYDAFPTKREEPHIFVRDSTIDEMLNRVSSDELFGRQESSIPTHTPFGLCTDSERRNLS